MHTALSKQDRLDAAARLIDGVRSGAIVPIFEKQLVRKVAGHLRPVSPLSFRLIAAVETAIGTTISCGKCRSYLAEIDSTSIPDGAVIAQRLAVDLPLPHTLRAKYNTMQKRQAWVQPIVDAVLLEWVDSDEVDASQ